MEKNQIFARHRRMLSIQRSVLQQIFEQSYYASDLRAYAEEFVKELRLINTPNTTRASEKMNHWKHRVIQRS